MLRIKRGVTKPNIIILITCFLLAGCGTASRIPLLTPIPHAPLSNVSPVSEPAEAGSFDHDYPTAIPTVFWTTNLINAQKSLFGEPCLAPCWYNIEPGKTTITGTATILNQLQEQGIIQDFYHIESPTTIGYVFIFTDSFDGSIKANKGIVEAISFGMSAQYLTLGELFSIYGEPSYVSSARGESYEGLMLAYPGSQLLAYVRTERLGGEQLVTSDLMINSLTYLLPLHFSESVEDNNQHWTQWDGQQTFSYYYQKAWDENQ